MAVMSRRTQGKIFAGEGKGRYKQRKQMRTGEDCMCSTRAGAWTTRIKVQQRQRQRRQAHYVVAAKASSSSSSSSPPSSSTSSPSYVPTKDIDIQDMNVSRKDNLHSLVKVTGPSAWKATDMRDREDEWTYHFSSSEQENILNHTREVCSRTQDDEDMTGDKVMAAALQMTMPTIESKIQQWKQDILYGRGFMLIRGTPTESLTPFERAAFFLYIGNKMGDPVTQNKYGHLLGHVYDLNNNNRNNTITASTRLYTTNRAQPFHTDSADIVGLLCLRPAKLGGESSIVSSSSIFNKVLEMRPDLAQTLMEPMYNDRKGEIPQGKQPYFQMPVFIRHNNRLLSMYDRTFIDAAQSRFGNEIPTLSKEQLDALDLIDELSYIDELKLDMSLRPGDIQLLHNHQLWHARSEYFDDEEDFGADLSWDVREGDNNNNNQQKHGPRQSQRQGGKSTGKRHLLRLWLSTQRDGWTLPGVFEERYGPLNRAIRGGITVPGQEPCTPLMPSYIQNQ